MAKLAIHCTSDYGVTWFPVIVQGTIVKRTIYGMTVFIHKGYNSDYFVVSEYKSGLQIEVAPTKKEALKESIATCRKHGKDGTLKALKTGIRKSGIANKPKTNVKKKSIHK